MEKIIFMKKKIVYVIILLVAVIAQTSILPAVSTTNATGDAVLMAVLAWAVLDGFSAFIGWAVVAGILYDLAAYSPVGEHALIFSVVVYFVSFFSRRLSFEFRTVGIILFFVLVIVATLLSRGISVLIVSLDMQTFNGYWKMLGSPGTIALEMIYNNILFLFWFVLLRKTKKFFGIEQI
jgi:rod shape-determining protein MreD